MFRRDLNDKKQLILETQGFPVYFQYIFFSPTGEEVLSSESYVLLVQWTILRRPTLLYSKSLRTCGRNTVVLDCLCTFLILKKSKHCSHKILCVKLIWICFRPLDMMLQCFRSLSETNFLWKKVQLLVLDAVFVLFLTHRAVWKPFSALLTVRRELKMAYFLSGLFWHRSSSWQKLLPYVLSLQVMCLSLWYVMAQALASPTCFSVGQIKYFARAWQQLGQRFLGIRSIPFTRKTNSLSDAKTWNDTEMWSYSI